MSSRGARAGSTGFAERLRGTTCNKPMARFGEHIMSLPLDALNTDENKIETKMKDGVWLGTIDRTDETIVGTKFGVVKCRTIRRRPEGQQWCAEAIQSMRGSVQQPVPGTTSDRIPTGIVDRSCDIARTLATRLVTPTPLASQPTTDHQRHNRRPGSREVWCYSRLPGLHRSITRAKDG